jgi:predicted DsbA family dithiol-disulfide isomerase
MARPYTYTKGYMDLEDAQQTVDFYFDPVCPWCWITSRWMMEVARERDLKINWKFFSLKKINKGHEVSEAHRVSHAAGLRTLRVAAVVREQHGNGGVGKFYTAVGARRHHDQKDIGDKMELAGALQECGFSPDLAMAADDEAHDATIEEDMAQASVKVGTDVGVPLIVLDGGEGPGFFGPVFSPAPTGKAALEMWDAMVVGGRTPGFYEFKRSRKTGPIFGERPKV